MAVKIEVQVWKHSGEYGVSEWKRLSEEELINDYCIWWDMRIWLRDSVPKGETIEKWSVNFYDIGNYESYEWYECDETTQNEIRKAYK